MSETDARKPKGSRTLDRSVSFRKRASLALRLPNFDKPEIIQTSRKESSASLIQNSTDIPDSIVSILLETIVFMSSRIEETACAFLEKHEEIKTYVKESIVPVQPLPASTLHELGGGGAFMHLVNILQTLPEPLLTYRLYPEFMTCGSVDEDDNEYQLCLLRSLVYLLPRNTLNVTGRLFAFFYQMCSRVKDVLPELIGSYFGCLLLSTYGGVKMVEENHASAAVSLLVEHYSTIFVNDGMGKDLVCQKTQDHCYVLYSSKKYAALLLLDPYYWQQDPSLQRLIFIFLDYFTTPAEILQYLVSYYGSEEDEEQKKKKNSSAPSTPRAEKRMARRVSEKRMQRQISKKLSVKLLGLIDPDAFCEMETPPHPPPLPDAGSPPPPPPPPRVLTLSHPSLPLSLRPLSLQTHCGSQLGILIPYRTHLCWRADRLTTFLRHLSQHQEMRAMRTSSGLTWASQRRWGRERQAARL